MAKQRKLSLDIGEYNDVGNVTEHEANFLPAVTKGTKALDLGFDNIYQYETLGPIAAKSRGVFKKAVIKRIGETDFNKIERGLKAYVRSASSSSQKLIILKASILNAFGDNLLTRLYDLSDDSIKQIIKPEYFENIDKYLVIDRKDLIPVSSIQYYQKKAVEITRTYYSMFLDKLDEPEDIYESMLYSGFGNYNYYEKEKNATADMLSVYSGLGNASSFFANQLLNSYSINNRVADHFMVMGNNARRAMFSVQLPIIMDDLFSSFFVCKHFHLRQYEFLVLPNRNEIFIHEEMQNELMTRFFLDDRTDSDFQDNIPSKSDILSISEEPYNAED